MPHMTSIFHILLWSLFCITHCNQAPLTVPRSLCNTTTNISCPQVTIWCDVSTFSVTGPYFFAKNIGSYHSRGFWAMLHHVARIFSCWTVKREAESEKCVVSTWWCSGPHSRQSIIFVVAMLAGCWISLGDIPLPSADWTVPEFFLWIYLKKFSS